MRLPSGCIRGPSDQEYSDKASRKTLPSDLVAVSHFLRSPSRRPARVPESHSARGASAPPHDLPLCVRQRTKGGLYRRARTDLFRLCFATRPLSKVTRTPPS